MTEVEGTVVRLHASSLAPSVAAEAAAQRDELTERLAALLGHPAAVVLTSSCTHSLEAAATMLDVGPGDEVIVPAFTFPSTANAFLLRGASLRFADVDPLTANISAESAADRTSERTRVIECVHYAGIGADMVGLGKVAADVGAVVVEDAAHGLFGSIDDVPLGTLGALGALSFHRTKNLSTVEGGALIVNDPSLVEAAFVAVDKGTNRRAFEHGQVAAYEWTGPGSGWRMADPLLPLLAEQLDHHLEIQARRISVWERYARDLAGWAHETGTSLPHVPRGRRHPAHLFHVMVADADDREPFTRWCAEHGVEVARHYGSLPDSRYGSQIRHPDDECPVATDLAARLVRLPLHHELSDADVDRVLDVVTTAPIGRS